jgi:citrate synthase
MSKSSRQVPKVERRNTAFSEKIQTKIWSETPSPDNPYVAEKCLIHGYNLVDITKNLSFSESIFLNIKGKLPSPDQLALFNAILSGLSNLGPRHAAVRAVMNAAVSKTKVQNLLPLGLAIASGEFLGAEQVEQSMRFISKNINKPAAQLATSLVKNYQYNSEENAVIAPGFGARFGQADSVCAQLATVLLQLNASGRSLSWAKNFCDTLAPHQFGWYITGVAAATFSDLGFTPKASAGLFQLAIAPGMLAHGLEMSGKPLTSMPFVDDSNYTHIGDVDEQ